MVFFGKKKVLPSAPEPDPRRSDRDDSSFFRAATASLDSAKVKVLLETLAELISTTDYELLLRSIVDKAIRIVGAERGFLFLFDENDPTRLLVKVARDATGRNLPPPHQYSKTMTKQVATDGEPQKLQVTSHDQQDLSQSVVDMKLRAAMCVSLKVQDKRLGVIYVDSRASAREFSSDDMRYFESLAASLAIAVENARLVRRTIDGERAREQVKIARRIQEGLLPRRSASIAGFDVAGRADPAEDALGDYFDIIPLPGGKVVVAIGDVSGHGVGPALLMTATRAVLRSFADSSFRIDRVLTRMSDRIYEDTGGEYFMSMFLAEIDTATRTLVYGNAGHPAPILLRADGRAEEMKGRDLALGFETGVDYGQHGPIKLESGDALLLMTDGILEARGKNEDFFGRERVVAAMRCAAIWPGAPAN
jgi:phosphoserine phosphatase RsbU/P